MISYGKAQASRSDAPDLSRLVCLASRPAAERASLTCLGRGADKSLRQRAIYRLCFSLKSCIPKPGAYLADAGSQQMPSKTLDEPHALDLGKLWPPARLHQTHHTTAGSSSRYVRRRQSCCRSCSPGSRREGRASRRGRVPVAFPTHQRLHSLGMRTKDRRLATAIHTRPRPAMINRTIGRQKRGARDLPQRYALVAALLPCHAG